MISQGIEKPAVCVPRAFKSLALLDAITLPQAFAIGYCGALLRTAFEYWIYRGSVSSYINVFIHYPLSFICFALCIAWFACYITNFPAYKACKIILTLLPVVALVPLIDVTVYGVRARAITYITPESNSLAQFVNAVFTRHYAEQISIGQVLIVHGTAIGVGLFCWRVTHKMMIAALGWIGVLAIIFFWATFPLTIREVARQCHIWAWQGVLGQENVVAQSTEQNSILGSTDAVSTAIYVLAAPIILIGLVRVNGRSHLWQALLRNSRLPRMAHYLVMALLGILLAIKNAGSPKLLLAHPTNVFAIAILLESVAAAFLSAVWINDVYDYDIDKHVHVDRPIVTGTVTIEAGRQISAILAGIALLAGCLLDSIVTMVVLLAWGASLAYSVPPLRLRRFFPVSLILLSCISVLIVQTGFVFGSAGMATGIPARTALGLVLGYALLLTFKDIRDAEGDALGGVSTLATLFPGRPGRVLTGASILLGVVVVTQALIPGYLGLVFGVCAGVLGMGIVLISSMKHEVAIFSAYFAAVIAIGYTIAVK